MRQLPFPKVSQKVTSMDDKRALLRHFLAALAYRTHKALGDAPVELGSFRAAEGVRPPAELVRHMTRTRLRKDLPCRRLVLAQSSAVARTRGCSFSRHA